MTMTKLAALVLAGALVVGCADQGPKQGAGTLLGGVGGALLGSQIGSGKGRLVGVAAGTLLGAMIGSEIGKSLDRADMAHMERTTHTALDTGRSGQPYAWRNPDSGHSGTIVAQPAYQARGGQYCREYQQTVSVGGKQEQAYGTACRQPDGSWQVVN